MIEAQRIELFQVYGHKNNYESGLIFHTSDA